MFIRQDPAVHRGDGQTAPAQRPGRRTVFPLGGIDDVFGQNAMVGFGFLDGGRGLAPGFPGWRHRRGGGRLEDGTWSGCNGFVDGSRGRACRDGPVDGSGGGGDWCGFVDGAG